MASQYQRIELAVHVLPLAFLPVIASWGSSLSLLFPFYPFVHLGIGHISSFLNLSKDHFQNKNGIATTWLPVLTVLDAQPP